MINSDLFWEAEKNAPLLNRNAGYISKQTAAKVREKAQEWVDLAQQKETIGLVDDSCRDVLEDATQRIFQLDAERTFSDPGHRKEMVEVLTSIHHETRDYHQGLGFVVAFLLLQLERKEVEKIVIALHRHYMPGYFKAAAVNYVRDAKVFEKILPIFFPDAAKKIIDSVAAEAYCSKWFVGLNVHVLTFEALALFFDAFLAKGHDFLYQFGLSLVKNCEMDIMNAPDVSRILSILRLDAELYPNSYRHVESQKKDSGGAESSVEENFFKKIVEDAVTFDIGKVSIESLREEVDREMAEAAERRRKRDAEMDLEDDDDEIVFSDEEEEENEDLEEEGEKTKTEAA